jgi:hypothetical protein
MTDATPPGLVCYAHPDRETYLRCNRCDRPICNSCAVRTPTGYRCKECLRGQQRVFETANPIDPVFGFIVAGVLAFPGSYIAQVMQLFTLFFAPILGLLITEAVRYVVRRRRSRNLFLAAAVGAAVGSLPLLLIILVRLFAGGFGMGSLLALVWQAAYTFLIAITVYNRLNGIQL